MKWTIQKQLFYKICCKDVNITDIYIGHITNFIKRKNQHKSDCNNPNSKSYNHYVYQFIRDNRGWENWDMVEIEKYNCNDRLEACKRERYWVEELKATLNKNLPSRTSKEYSKEYYIENKAKLIEKQRKYENDNKDKIKLYKNQICICNICNCNYTKQNKSQHEKTQKHQDNLNN